MAVPAHIVKVIKTTTPVVAPLVPAIVKTFYDNLFSKHPVTKNFFPGVNMANDTQFQSLGAALTAAVVNIEDLSVLNPRLTEIFHRHVGLEILPAHYDALHGCLMDAIAKEVPNEHLTPEVVKGWSDFVLLLNSVFTSEEEKLYKLNETRGWRGFKDLKLIRKEPVGKDVMTFAFQTEKPVDFKAGQYITVKSPTLGDSWAPEARRHYTVTGVPGKNELEISTKHAPNGAVSGYMHKKLEVGSTLPVAIPMGLATVNSSKAHVLVSAGIGITSSLAAFQELPKEKLLSFVHVDQNEAAHPLKDRVPKAGDKNLKIYTDDVGRLNADELVSRILKKTGDGALNDAVFRLCGPPAWMYGLNAELKKRGAKDIQAEFFASKKADI